MNMQNSMWDKSLISFIISPIVGVLVMEGVIAPNHADLIAQQAELWVGATIFLGGLLIGVLHHHTIQSNQGQYLSAEEEAILHPELTQPKPAEPLNEQPLPPIPTEPPVAPAEQPAN